MSRRFFVRTVACLALVLAMAPAYAADYTAHVSGVSGSATDFAGASAVKDALAAIEAAPGGSGDTVTITESGTYVGDLCVTTDVTIQVDSGVQPVIQGDWTDAAIPATVSLGVQYDGTGTATGSLAIIGDTPANRLIIEGNPDATPGQRPCYDPYSISATPALGSTIMTNVEFRNNSATTALWRTMGLYHDETFTDCLWNGAYNAGLTYAMLLNAEIAIEAFGGGTPLGNLPPTFIDCEFNQLNTLIHDEYTHVLLPLHTATFTTCDFIGQAGVDDFALMRTGAHGNQAVTTPYPVDYLFDGCTYTISPATRSGSITTRRSGSSTPPRTQIRATGSASPMSKTGISSLKIHHCRRQALLQLWDEPERGAQFHHQPLPLGRVPACSTSPVPAPPSQRPRSPR